VSVNAYLSEIKRAVGEMHGDPALWLETVHVKEVFQGETAWEGDVEVFALPGNRGARRCYAWGVRRDDDKGWDVTAVLGTPPINSPQDAVKAAIAAYARQQTPRRSGKP
jgi:hypothetical protein